MILLHRWVGLGGVWLVLCAAAASGAVIYEHHFNGSRQVSLNGLAPDTGQSVWIAHSDWRADGTAGSYSSATLPFVPRTGAVYRLSARLTEVTGNGDWLALGFAAGSSTSRGTNSDRFIEGATAGGPWMLRRGDQAAAPDQAFTGPGTVGGADIPTLDRSADVDFAIVLDTRQAAWSVEWQQKRTDQIVWQTVRTHSYTTRPDIAAVGLARANIGTTGRVAYFCLEEREQDAAFVSQGQPADAAVLEGHGAFFEARFISGGTPTVQWFRLRGSEITLMEAVDGSSAITVRYDAVEEQWYTALHLFAVAGDDEGAYVCVVTSEGGFVIQSEPARLTVKRLLAHWTLNAGDYQLPAHLDKTAGLRLVGQGPARFIMGAAETPQAAIQVGSGGAGTSEPLSAVFENGFAISLWADLSQTTALTVSDGQAAMDGGLLAQGRWRHVCLVFDGQMAGLYVDGRFAGEQDWPLSSTYEVVLDVGHAFGQDAFLGGLDDVRLYNFPLSGDEVYELYARRTGDGGCVLEYAYWVDLSGPKDVPDCRVDWYDFAAMARQWVAAEEPAMGLSDVAAFARSWLSDGMVMNADADF
jgi:hypothetical protein